MSVNKYRPHVFVLPEDGANREVANGFQKYPFLVSERIIQVLPEAGGWIEVLHEFENVHRIGLERYEKRFMILVIDFDGQEDRLEQAKGYIPEHVEDRVFVLGAWTEPEALKGSLGSYETIGQALAKDCREDTDTTWGHALLRHNGSEVERLRRLVRPILFGG